MTDFTDLHDGAQQLAAVIKECAPICDVVVGVAPNGLPAAHAVARVLNVSVVSATRVDANSDFKLDAGSPDSGSSQSVTAKTVIVCDDGVETGRAARTLGQQLRDMGAMSVSLAVPVCPREIEPSLRQIYDEIFAVVRPLARRSLSWHYERL